MYGNYVNATVEKYGGDLSRQTKFTVDLTLPDPVSRKLDKRTYDVMCKSLTVPTTKMEPIEVKYKGHSIPTMGRVQYEQTVTLTFILDDKHQIREIMKNWIEGLDDWNTGKKTTESLDLKSNKKGEIKLSAKDFLEQFSPAVYTFKNVYPTSVAGLEYDGTSTSVFNEITVDFAFTHIESTMEEGVDFSNLFEDILGGITAGISTAIFGNEERLDVVPALGDFFSKFKG